MFKKARRSVVSGQAVVANDLLIQRCMERFVKIDPSLAKVMNEDTFRFFISHGRITFHNEELFYLHKPMIDCMRYESFSDGSGHLSYSHIRHYPTSASGIPEGNMLVSFKRVNDRNDLTYDMFYGDSLRIALFTFAHMMKLVRSYTPIHDLPPEIAFLYWGFHSPDYLGVEMTHNLIRSADANLEPSRRFIQTYADSLLPNVVELTFQGLYQGAPVPSAAKDTTVPFEMYIPALAVARCCVIDAMMLDTYNHAFIMMTDLVSGSSDRDIFMSVFHPAFPFDVGEREVCKFAHFVVMNEMRKLEGVREQYFLGSCDVRPYEPAIAEALPAQRDAVDRLVYNTEQGRRTDAQFFRCPMASTIGIELVMDELNAVIAPFIGSMPEIDQDDKMWYFVSSVASWSGVFVHRDMVDIVHLGQLFLLYMHRSRFNPYTTPPFALLARLIFDFAEKKEILDGRITAIAHSMIMVMVMRNAGYTIRQRKAIALMTFDHGRGQMVEPFLRITPYLILKIHGVKNVSRYNGAELYDTATRALNEIFNDERSTVLFNAFRLFVSDPTEEVPFTFDANLLQGHIAPEWKISDDATKVLFDNTVDLAYFLHFLLRTDDLSLDWICDVIISATVHDNPVKQVDDQKHWMTNRRMHTNLNFFEHHMDALSIAPVELTPTSGFAGSSVHEHSVVNFDGFLTVLFMVFEMFGSRDDCPCSNCPLRNYAVHNSILRSSEFVVCQGPLGPLNYGSFFMSRRDVPFFNSPFQLISHLSTHYKRNIKMKSSIME